MGSSFDPFPKKLPYDLNKSLDAFWASLINNYGLWSVSDADEHVSKYVQGCKFWAKANPQQARKILGLMRLYGYEIKKIIRYVHTHEPKRSKRKAATIKWKKSKPLKETIDRIYEQCFHFLYEMFPDSDNDPVPTDLVLNDIESAPIKRRRKQVEFKRKPKSRLRKKKKAFEEPPNPYEDEVKH